MVCSLLSIYSIHGLLKSRRRGIEARRKFVAPVGAWFSQVGRLHQVHHMWQYPYVLSDLSLTVALDSPRTLHERKEKREQAWQIDGWAETVSKVYPIIQV